MNNFRINVTAVDGFTKTFDKLNKTASRAANGPLAKFGRNMRSMTGPQAGWEPTIKGFRRATDVTIAFGRSLGATSSSLETMMNLGGAAGLAGIAMSMAKLASGFSATGAEVKRTSGLIGVSADDLQRYRGAAKLAGSTSDEFTSSLTNISKTMQDAQFGRNPEAFAVLAHFGIEFKRNKDGVIDAVAAYRDLADVMAKLGDPMAQRKLAEIFGINDGTLATMKNGSAAIEQYARAAERLGMVLTDDQIKKASSFAESLNKLKGALDAGATNAGGRLMWLQNGMNGISNFMSADPSSSFSPSFKRAADQQKLKRDLWSKIFGPGYTPSTPAERMSSGIVQDSTQGPLGIRLNNWGNLRNANGKGFQSFASAQDGLQAMAQQLLRYQYDPKWGGLNTLRKIVNTYAPPSENDTGAYLKNLVGRTGFGADQSLSLADPQQLIPIMRAKVRQEQGRDPGTPEQYAAAVAAALQNMKLTVNVQNAPAGSTVNAQLGNPYEPTAVSYPLPMGSLP